MNKKLNNKEKKDIAIIIVIISAAVFFTLILPVILYLHNHHRGAHLNSDGLFRDNPEQTQNVDNESTTENTNENIEIIPNNDEKRLDASDIKFVDLEEIDTKIQNSNSNDSKYEKSSEFYRQIKEQLDTQKNLPKVKVPSHYYQVKDNYIKNCTDNSGVLHTYKKKPILIYVPKGDYYDQIMQAFMAYNNQFKGLIEFNTVSSAKDADIQIVFSDDLSEENDNEDVVGLGSPTKYSQSGDILASKIYLRTIFHDKKVSKIQMYDTVLHEIGHAIGIDGHSSDVNDVMYKAENYSLINKIKPFSQRDINTLIIMYSDNQYLKDRALVGAQQEKIKENVEYAETSKGADAYLAAADSYFKAKQYTKAMEQYQKALKINPDNPRIYLDLAYCYFDLKQYNNTLTYAKTALQKSYTNEDRSRAYQLIGLAYEYAGKNKEAIPNYYGALAAEPSEPSNFYNYILSCTKNKQYKQAKDAYNTYFHLYKTADFNKKQLELFDYIKKYKP